MNFPKLSCVSLVLVAAVLGGCRSGPSYRTPKGGVMASDPCGLQIVATSVKAGGGAFSVVFDLANESDQGLLVPYQDLEAMWGQQVAKVTTDARQVKHDHVPTPTLKMPGSIDQGLFAGTQWVTGSKGEGPRGEAIFVKAKSRATGLRVDCRVQQQPGEALVVRWPHIYSGDAQGTIQSTVASNVTWTMLPTMPGTEAESK